MINIKEAIRDMHKKEISQIKDAIDYVYILTAYHLEDIYIFKRYPGDKLFTLQKRVHAHPYDNYVNIDMVDGNELIHYLNNWSSGYPLSFAIFTISFDVDTPIDIAEHWEHNNVRIQETIGTELQYVRGFFNEKYFFIFREEPDRMFYLVLEDVGCYKWEIMDQEKLSLFIEKQLNDSNSLIMYSNYFSEKYIGEYMKKSISSRIEKLRKEEDRIMQIYGECDVYFFKAHRENTSSPWLIVHGSGLRDSDILETNTDRMFDILEGYMKHYSDFKIKIEMLNHFPE